MSSDKKLKWHLVVTKIIFQHGNSLHGSFTSIKFGNLSTKHLCELASISNITYKMW
jgi:hypothetical protein